MSDEAPRLANEELRRLMRERNPRELVMLAERVKRTGGCEHPVRLRATGSGSPSVGEPDGVLLLACKSRRETRCEPCAATYRGDARQIVRAGLKGGKGMPVSVASHPAVFVTLTLPRSGRCIAPVELARSAGQRNQLRELLTRLVPVEGLAGAPVQLALRLVEVGPAVGTEVSALGEELAK